MAGHRGAAARGVAQPHGEQPLHRPRPPPRRRCSSWRPTDHRPTRPPAVRHRGGLRAPWTRSTMRGSACGRLTRPAHHDRMGELRTWFSDRRRRSACPASSRRASSRRRRGAAGSWSIAAGGRTEPEARQGRTHPRRRGWRHLDGGVRFDRPCPRRRRCVEPAPRRVGTHRDRRPAGRETLRSTPPPCAATPTPTSSIIAAGSDNSSSKPAIMGTAKALKASTPCALARPWARIASSS